MRPLAVVRLHREVGETRCVASRPLSATCNCDVFLTFQSLQFTASF
jgi:threonine dehydratase